MACAEENYGHFIEQNNLMEQKNTSLLAVS